ncbi:hypothetical protein [Anaplasma centrale]|nr:hypothetical protein [Anaplasma centrale]
MSTEVERQGPVAAGREDVDPSNPCSMDHGSLEKRTGKAETKLKEAGVRLARDTAAIRQATRPTESEIGAISRFVEKRTREYMDKFYDGMKSLGITEDHVVSHQRILKREALNKGAEFTKKDRQGLARELGRAALDPGSNAAKQFAQKVKESHKILEQEAQKVKESHAKVQGARAQQTGPANHSSPEFMFPTPKAIRELPGASEYPKVMAQLFPDATRVSAWKLLRAEELLTAHIKAGLNPDTFNFESPAVLPSSEEKHSKLDIRARYEREWRAIRNHLLKEAEAMSREAACRHAEWARSRARRDAELMARITQHNYEASVRALEDEGLVVSDEIKAAIMKREKALEQAARERAASGFLKRVSDTIREAVRAFRERFLYNEEASRRTAEVEAKLERAGVKIEEQSEVAVDVSRLPTTARSTDNSSQLRDTSAQVEKDRAAEERKNPLSKYAQEHKVVRSRLLETIHERAQIMREQAASRRAELAKSRAAAGTASSEIEALLILAEAASVRLAHLSLELQQQTPATKHVDARVDVHAPRVAAPTPLSFR